MHSLCCGTTEVAQHAQESCLACLPPFPIPKWQCAVRPWLQPGGPCWENARRFCVTVGPAEQQASSLGEICPAQQRRAKINSSHRPQRQIDPMCRTRPAAGFLRLFIFHIFHEYEM
ncbi:hypothetical protein MAPG_05210 [Magnaporthiopsis poae ATCC 64411]|uniref:Uncharacterized protein n=1 Tax=Magnaporthiopsis poae (strain ATCC 64411 / 73-15) TaxID=644358 RepID=A0A0C4DYT1_MAGP6|nr:hypothetical protein MAPG_05210 [Magnaporthiopsis poae ATCC 64411]